MRGGIVMVFALLPSYYRFSVNVPPPLGFPDLYVSYFLLILPMLWTVFWWIVAGLPGWVELQRDPLRALFILLLLSLSLWGFTSQLWAFQRLDHPEVGQTAGLQLGIVALFVTVLTCAGPSARTIITVLMIGLVWNSVLTIAQVTQQSWLGLWFFDEVRFSTAQTGASVLRVGELQIIRPYGLMPHPNILAGTLLTGVFAAVGGLVGTSERLRGWLLLLIPIGFYALLVTFSRAAWLAVALGGFAILPLLRVDLRRPVVRRSLLLAAVGCFLVGSLFVVQFAPFLAARTGAVTESIELRSVADRIVFIDFAQRSIAEQPMFGVGLGHFPWRTSYFIAETFYDLRGDNVHHVLLSAWAELGAVGFVLVVGALMCGIEAAIRQIRHGGISASERAAKMALLGIVMALIVVGLLDHYPWTILNFQVIWWGSLAIACRPLPAEAVDLKTNATYTLQREEHS
jgi:O-antigen ligase